MKKIIIWILTIFILTSCYSNTEKNNNDDNFNKKLKCNSIKKEIEKRIVWNKEILLEVFYSPKLNSCISRIVSIKPPQFEIMKDELTGKEIITRNQMCWWIDEVNIMNICIANQKKFDKKLQELKN